MIDSNDLTTLTEAVVNKLKEKYILVEKTFNLDLNETEAFKEKMAKVNTFIDNLTNIACHYYRIDKQEFLSQEKLKNKYLNLAHCCGYLCRELPETPIPQMLIGSYYNKNHATINHWQKQAEKKIQNSFEFKYELGEIKKLVEQSLKL